MAKNIKKKFKPREEKDIDKDYNPPIASSRSRGSRAPELKSLEDLPLIGGLFKGLEKFIDLVEKVEEAGGEIKRKGEIKGKEGVRGIYGFSIGTGIGERPKIQTFGNIRSLRKRVGAKEAKPEFKITETREPIVDVFDEKEHILVVAELPGINEKEIKTSLNGDILILEASHQNPEGEPRSTTSWLRGRQVPYGAGKFGTGQAGEEEKRKYYKEILLPSKVNPETEEKTYKNGILEIKFKKVKVICKMKVNS